MKKQPLLPKHTKTLFETEGRKATTFCMTAGRKPCNTLPETGRCVCINDGTNICIAQRKRPHDLSEG